MGTGELILVLLKKLMQGLASFPSKGQTVVVYFQSSLQLLNCAIVGQNQPWIIYKPVCMAVSRPHFTNKNRWPTGS